MASGHRSLHFADAFVISCGTVVVDIAKSKILLIKWLGKGEVLLAKGRKNIGESLEDTAIRETYEETGIHARLRPTSFRTNHTIAPGQDMAAHTEPLAMQQRMSAGALKVIFWYIGEADSDIPAGAKTGEEGEDYENAWTSFGELEAVLTYRDDWEICRQAIQVVQAV